MRDQNFVCATLGYVWYGSVHILRCHWVFQFCKCSGVIGSPAVEKEAIEAKVERAMVSQENRLRVGWRWAWGVAEDIRRLKLLLYRNGEGPRCIRRLCSEDLYNLQPLSVLFDLCIMIMRRRGFMHDQSCARATLGSPGRTVHIQHRHWVASLANGRESHGNRQTPIISYEDPWFLWEKSILGEGINENDLVDTSSWPRTQLMKIWPRTQLMKICVTLLLVRNV